MISLKEAKRWLGKHVVVLIDKTMELGIEGTAKEVKMINGKWHLILDDPLYPGEADGFDIWNLREIYGIEEYESFKRSCV